MVWLNRTYYSLLKIYKQNFQNCPLQSKFQQITQIPRNSPTQSANYAKLAHFVNIFYLCFRHLPRQRTLQNSSELCRFRTIRPHSLRITQNLHHLFTLYITFQISDNRQRTQENWSESTRFHSIRPPITRITRIPRILQ